MIMPHKALITFITQVLPELFAPYMQADLITLSQDVSITFDDSRLFRISAFSENCVSLEKINALLNFKFTNMVIALYHVFIFHASILHKK